MREVVVGLVETRLGKAFVAGDGQQGIAQHVVVGAAVNIAELGRSTQTNHQTGQAIVLVIQTFQLLKKKKKR